MSSAKKAVKTDDTKFPVISGSDGHKYVDPLESGGKYLVRKYDTPEVDDLPAIRGLIKDFEQRFLHFVDRGYTVTKTSPEKLDTYIEHERQVLRGIQEQRQKNNDPENQKETEELTKRWLATALTGRAMRLMKYHLKQREQGADPATLDESYRRVSNDVMEVLTLGASLRGKRGYMDDDTVIAEMFGEPQKLFIAAIAANAKGVEEFYDGRYVKVAQAMKSVDKTVAILSKVTAKFNEFETPLKNMAEAAKHKIQIQHGDPDYPEVDKKYIALRDDIQEMIGKKMGTLVAEYDRAGTKHMREVKADKITEEVKALNCIKQAADIIYDVAVTRNPRDTGVKQLTLEVECAGLSKPAHHVR